MAFAGHCGVTVSLDGLAFDAAADDVDAFKRNADEQLAGRAKDLALRALFSEELGAVVQIRAADRARVMDALRAAGLGEHAHVIGSLNTRDEIRITRNNRPVFVAKRDHLQRVWSETSWRMQTLRDNPDCAREEYDRVIELNDPGLSVSLSSKIAPFVGSGRPRIAILREQGVNGQVEMAAAFDRAGFESVDVHMTDLISGRITLDGFKGFAAGGGFSYGDVLGGGQGWAKTILFNPRARAEFEKFFARRDTFAIGACNGCQMMGALRELIPGASGWPLFVKNRSEQFEARLVMVEIVNSPSILFAGMESPVPPYRVNAFVKSRFSSANC
jgi:phosphoribosylformylglycinamidine synthase